MKTIRSTRELKKLFEDTYVKQFGQCIKPFPASVRDYAETEAAMFAGFRLAHDLMSPGAWEFTEGQLSVCDVHVNRPGAYHTYFTLATNAHSVIDSNGPNVYYDIDYADAESMEPPVRIEYVDFTFVLYQVGGRDLAYFSECVKELDNALPVKYSVTTMFDPCPEDDRFVFDKTPRKTAMSVVMRCEIPHAEFTLMLKTQDVECERV